MGVATAIHLSSLRHRQMMRLAPYLHMLSVAEQTHPLPWAATWVISAFAAHLHLLHS
jgi:hypothetical protein